MIWFYRLLFLPALLLALPYYILRMWRRGGYGKLLKYQFGLFDPLPSIQTGKTRIWLQAVSVGEVLAVGPLIESLNKDPKIEIVLTTGTSTGYHEACKRYEQQVLSIGAFPLDFWLFNRLAWKRIQPNAIILTESELWPEHLHRAKKSQVPTFLVNARMSDRSFRRYQKLSALAGRMLKKFDAIYTASDLDRARLIELGVTPEQIRSSGNIKFDAPIGEQLTPEARTQLRAELGFSAQDSTPFILLGSSTWPGEEQALLTIQDAAIQAGIDCRLLLVPRHAERRDEICKLLADQDRIWYQRSSQTPLPDALSIHLADTTGELARLTQAADLAFIGKSLPPNHGGQTPIEAIGLGTPILMGPNMNNFKDLAKSLVTAGAAERIEDIDTLSQAIIRLARDASARQNMRTSGIDLHQASRGSSERIAANILSELHSNTNASGL